MGDSIQNNDIFKKLGFDSSNQWILYDDSLQKFFNWMSENITDENILSDDEVLKEEYLKQNKQYLESDELLEKLEILNKDYPSILNYTEDDILMLENEVVQTKQISDMYKDLGTKMQSTKINLNCELHELDNTINVLENQVDTMYKNCLEKSNELQEHQKKNLKLCKELNDCFKVSYSPPLFTHELPLDQYLLKCDSFMQYFELYLQENFKFQSFDDSENDDPHPSQDCIELENIKNHLCYYNEKYILAEAQLFSLNYITNEMDRSNFIINNSSDLKKETEDLQIVNNNFDITYETLMNELKLYLEQISLQQIELVLYDNTKEKLEKATKRLDNVKCLSKIISDAISNTELIWILMQLDSEKIKNRFDNTEQLQREYNLCRKRIDRLCELQKSPNLMSEMYISQLTQVFQHDLNIKTYNSGQKCLHEYRKFDLVLEHILKNIPSQQKYKQIIDFLNNSNLLEKILKSYVYNGPVKKPVFENMEFLIPIFQSKINEKQIEKNIRELRSEFHEKISVPMNSDKLWRYSQLLWIWFLTEPTKIMIAIEEVRRVASKVPSITGVKTLTGIKRK